MLPIPPVRPEHRADGALLVDGARCPLHPAALAVVEALDGQRGLSALAEHLGQPEEDVAGVVVELARLDLLAAPDGDRLPTLGPEQALTCTACGAALAVPEAPTLLAPEALAAERLDGGVLPVEAADGGRLCYALPSTCAAPRPLPEGALPSGCCAPLVRVVWAPDGVRVSLAGDGAAGAADGAALRALAGELAARSPFPVWSLYLPAEVPLGAETAVGFERYAALEAELCAALAEDPEPALAAALRARFAEVFPERTDADAASALLLLAGFAQLLSDDAGKGEDVRAMAERLRGHILQLPVDPAPVLEGDVRQRAGGILAAEVRALRPLSRGRAWLEGLVLLALGHVLAKWLAFERAEQGPLSPAGYAAAFRAVQSRLDGLELPDAAALYVFAAAPDLAPASATPFPEWPNL